MLRSDVDLLHAHLAGDRRAFHELVDRYAGLLWAVARRTLSNDWDAADAVQDALVRAHQGAAGYRGEARIGGWLVRILVNSCRDHHRYRRRRPVSSRGEQELAALPTTRDPITEHDLRMDVRNALIALPLEQRLVVVLVHMHGYPTDEVAKMLGISVGTVKSRGARARAKLAKALASQQPRRSRPPEEP